MEKIKQEVWQTLDGRTFLAREAAQHHEINIRLEAYVRERGYGRGGEWSQQLILDQLTADAGLLYEILKDYFANNKGKDNETES